ncbi:hypothetical protein [Sideroxyarcus emersonii]|uniref:hypothetical protein n=1 Tax=Sideroxyarcus emersonii TaxID=2764705 RepID=UPI001F44FE04|nr:hypothetical protein [Sideroxyarcus emersonii]
MLFNIRRSKYVRPGLLGESRGAGFGVLAERLGGCRGVRILDFVWREVLIFVSSEVLIFIT